MSTTTGITQLQTTKFGLNYRLTVTNSAGAELRIGMPFTCEFDVVRNNYAYCNTAQLRVMNLAPINQNFLLHDQNDYSPDHALYVTLQAGYGPGPNWPVIFKGNVTRGYSLREGVDFVTNLECYDGGLAYQNGKSSVSYPAGVTTASVIRRLVQDLAPYGVSVGAIDAALGGVLTKGGSYSGNTLDVLRAITNGNYFVDNLTFNALIPGSAIQSTPLLLDAAAGLLETPLKEQQYLEIKTLFEPRVAIGTLVNLQASTNQTYNGVHQCIGIHHRGTISAAVSSETTTTLSLQAGTFAQVAAQGGV